MTQGEMSEAVGLGRTGYVRIENGERRMEANMLVAVAAALNVAPCWLLVPWGDDETLTIGDAEVSAEAARPWVRGGAPLPGADPRTYFASVPLSEYRPPRSE